MTRKTRKTITPNAVGISVLGYIPPEALEDETPTGMAKPLATFASRLGDLALELEESIDEIEENPELSPIGKAERRRELFVEILGSFDDDELAKRIEFAERKIESARQLPEPPDAEDPNAIAVAGEIRRHVAGMDRSERFSFFREHAGDRQVVSALLNAPPYLSGLESSEVDAFREIALEALHPERVTRIDLLERTIDGARRARRNAERMMAERAGLSRDPDGNWQHALRQPARAPAPGQRV